MAEPLENRPRGGYGSGEFGSPERPSDYRRSRFDEDDVEAEVPEIEAPSKRELSESRRYALATVVVALGMGATGFIGSQLVAHSREVRELLPGTTNAPASLDLLFGGFVLLAGLLTGATVAGILTKRAWAVAGMIGLAATLMTAFAYTTSMRAEIHAITTSGDDSCRSALITAVPANAAPRQRVSICQVEAKNAPQVAAVTPVTKTP